MSKKVIIAGVLLLLFVAGGGIFLSLKKTNSQSKSSNEQGSQQAQSNSQPTDAASKGSLLSLLTSGKTQVCTYNADNNSVVINGTIYVADKKMRSDFTSTVNSTTTNAHIIVDTDYSYFWSDNSTLGIKNAIPKATPTPSETSDAAMQDNSTNTNLNEEITYNCSNWTADDSKFTLPSNITFTDYSQVTGAPTLAPITGTENQPSCSVCNSVPKDQQQACLKQLNCL